MKFVNIFSTGEATILENFPNFTSHELVGDDSGWDNYSIQVDHEYIFRFPRREDARLQIRQEVEVLNLLKLALDNRIEVPDYLATELNRDYPFVYYKMITGEPLNKEFYNGLSNQEKVKLADDIASFLNTLHAIDTSECPTLERIDGEKNYRDFYQEIQAVCFKYLTNLEQEKTTYIFDRYSKNPNWRDFVPTVLHGDLSEKHILITENGIGIIDFGDEKVFDPAIDLSWFYLFGKQLFNNVLANYSTHKDSDFQQRISQFYVPIIPYHGIIYGEEVNNQELISEELQDLKTNLAKL